MTVECLSAEEVLASAKKFQDFNLTEWKRRWPNFRPSEFACRGSGLVPTAKQFFDSLDCLQALRRAHGKPLFINSAYRSPKYNKSIGGASRSQHPLGRAFDVSIGNLDPFAFEELAISYGFQGIGRYKTFIHIDTREQKARWTSGQWEHAWQARQQATSLTA